MAFGEYFLFQFLTVGGVVERMKQRKAKEPDFQKVLEKTKDKLNKSQERI